MKAYIPYIVFIPSASTPKIRFRGGIALGKVSKGIGCSVSGCSAKAEVSLSTGNVAKYLNVDKSTKRTYLCKQHYKEYKHLSKEERKLERVRYHTV